MEQASEKGIEWVVKEGGIGGVIGLIVGAVLGFPREHRPPFLARQGIDSLTHWSNAFTTSLVQKDVILSMVGAMAVFGIAGALIGIFIKNVWGTKDTATTP
jgi:hypothetical protein